MHMLKFLLLSVFLFILGCSSQTTPVELSETEIPVQSLAAETLSDTASPEATNETLLADTEPLGSETAVAQLVAKPILEATVIEQEGLQSTSLGEITPVHQLEEIYLAGQPTEQDIAILRENGFKTIISLRKPGEINWDEQSAIEQQGMQFIHVPFSGEQELTSEVFEKLLPLLCDKEQQPMLLHCGSANRVGAIWYAHRMLEDNLSHEEALAEAKITGLKNEAYLQKAREYVLAAQLLGGSKAESE